MTPEQVRAFRSYMNDLVLGLVDQASAFTCREAEALYGLLRLAGLDGDAERFMQWHAHHDDDGDEHIVTRSDEYGQPVGWGYNETQEDE